uniref:Xylulose kinase-1 n=1 Tax=Tanacetum cinerariifolium TaxID=118510 RepID=A0A699GRV6_TANCI|nr:hypothetical protein [Tanacetum cinerariifolium]
MAPLTFTDTHNMIVFLTKSDASEGFDQIVDFLKTHMIQYALMVNPTIYVSCIKKFWTSVSIKKSNDVVRLMYPNKGKITKLDVDEDVTLVDAKEDMNDDVQGRLAESQAEPVKVEEVIEVVTAAKLMTEVVTTAATTITAAQVPNASAPRRMRGLVIQDPEETAISSVIMQFKVKSKDKALKRKPVTKAQARKNMMIYLKNMAGFKMDFFKAMTYNDVRPIFKKHYNSIKSFLEKGEEEIEEEGSKRKGDSLNQDASKKQRIDKEEEELKTHLQIVVNDDDDDDDVYTETTPLALKVPVVDYQIHHKNNKPYYKIIGADGTHKFFISFISLLNNFDRKDLEMLWKLVQERFQSSEPKFFQMTFC